jgi:hypothetical protein
MNPHTIPYASRRFRIFPLCHSISPNSKCYLKAARCRPSAPIPIPDRVLGPGFPVGLNESRSWRVELPAAHSPLDPPLSRYARHSRNARGFLISPGKAENPSQGALEIGTLGTVEQGKITRLCAKPLIGETWTYKSAVVR